MSFYPGHATGDGERLTIDHVLQETSIIEERIANLTEGQLFVDQIFTPDNTPVEGGSVIYGQVLRQHCFTDEDPTARMPGDEYQVLYRLRPDMRTAAVQDFGGKFAVTDEAVRRNRTADFNNDVTALTNTIVRKINAEAISALNAAIAQHENTDNMTAIGSSYPWDLAFAIGAPDRQTGAASLPAATIARAMALAEEKDETASFNRLIVHPRTRAALRTCYGTGLKDVLEDLGLELISTNDIDKGMAILVDQGRAGFIRYEEPLTVTSWRDDAHRQTWIQAYACPVMGITNPSAIATIHGVDAEGFPPEEIDDKHHRDLKAAHNKGHKDA